MTKKMKPKQAGFSLIEIMVTLVIGAIVVGVGLPQLSNIMKSNRLSTSVNELVFALNITRSEAMKSNSASICVSNNQTSCTPGSWDQGWIVFSDLNSNCVLNAGEMVIKASEPLHSLINVGVSGVGTCFTYGGNGFLMPAGTSASFNLCDDRTGSKAGRTITVITSGRPSTESYGACPTV